MLCFLNLTVNFFAWHCAWKYIWIWKQGTKSQDIIFLFISKVKDFSFPFLQPPFRLFISCGSLASRNFRCTLNGFFQIWHSVMPGECVHKPSELKNWTVKFVWNSILRWSYRQISITLEIQNTHCALIPEWYYEIQETFVLLFDSLNGWTFLKWNNI